MRVEKTSSSIIALQNYPSNRKNLLLYRYSILGDGVWADGRIEGEGWFSSKKYLAILCRIRRFLIKNIIIGIILFFLTF